MTWPGATDPQPLVIGLVNNMAPGAMAATERHFLDLLRAASPGRSIRLRRLTCLAAGRETNDAAPHPVLHAGVRTLRETPVDGLIVTGAAPATNRLEDEPTWPGMTWLADWAAANAVPVVWSCLAAHAAVRRLDGLERVRLPQKLSGVFDCDTMPGRHEFAAGLPDRMLVPHSRYHDIPSADLEANGYRIVSRSDAVGADAFVKECGAPFLFLQGHPEYEADTLLREYRRDVLGCIEGTRDDYPSIPDNYFDPATAASLTAFGEAAASRPRDRALVGELSSLLRAAVVSPDWRSPAVRLMANWLGLGLGADMGCGVLPMLTSRPGVKQPSVKPLAGTGG